MDERDEDVLIAEQRGHVRYLTLNRPDVLNALNARVFASLRTELASVASDPGTRVLVITGAGDGFCSGADMEDSGTPFEIERRLRQALAATKAG